MNFNKNAEQAIKENQDGRIKGGIEQKIKERTNRKN